MPMFRKKPVVIEATQWFKNGDHPEDDVHLISGGRTPAESEGKVVRRYRNPIGDGNEFCQFCKNPMHVHGWIDTLEGGHIVCPGDWIIKGVKGEFYPCKPDIFEQTYVPASMPFLREDFDIQQDFLDTIAILKKQGYVEVPDWMPVGLDGYSWAYVAMMHPLMRPAPKLRHRIRYGWLRTNRWFYRWRVDRELRKDPDGLPF